MKKFLIWSVISAVFMLYICEILDFISMMRRILIHLDEHVLGNFVVILCLIQPNKEQNITLSELQFPIKAFFLTFIVASIKELSFYWN